MSLYMLKAASTATLTSRAPAPTTSSSLRISRAPMARRLARPCHYCWGLAPSARAQPVLDIGLQSAACPRAVGSQAPGSLVGLTGRASSSTLLMAARTGTAGSGASGCRSTTQTRAGPTIGKRRALIPHLHCFQPVVFLVAIYSHLASTAECQAKFWLQSGNEACTARSHVAARKKGQGALDSHVANALGRDARFEHF